MKPPAGSAEVVPVADAALGVLAEVVYGGPAPVGIAPAVVVSSFNEAEGRTQAEVVAVFDEAIRRVDAAIEAARRGQPSAA